MTNQKIIQEIQEVMNDIANVINGHIGEDDFDFPINKIDDSVERGECSSCSKCNQDIYVERFPKGQTLVGGENQGLKPSFLMDECIAKGKTCCGKSLYYINRDAIKRMFSDLVPYSWEVVYMRLVMIDTLYSTNVNSQRYYGIKELTDEIWMLAPNNESKLRCLVKEFRDCAIGGSKKKSIIRKSFDKPYGIHANLNDGGKAVSLLSKYFYFLLLVDPKETLGFPIYDNLAKKMYSPLCKKVEIAEKSIVSKNKLSDICTYIKALYDLANHIGVPSVGLQTFDLLDAYLWRMGKFSQCNFSLLLVKCEYQLILIPDVKASGMTIDDYRDNMSCPISCNQLFCKLWNHWQKYYKI